MEGTGTNARTLLARVYSQTGVNIDPGLFSHILSGGRRCSAWNAGALSRVTGVPIDELVKWPKKRDS